MQLIVADDSVIVREGLVRLLREAGHQVVGAASDTEQLTNLLERLPEPPDVAVLDIRMPPTHTDEGARAALLLRQAHPQVGILLLSQHVEAHYALQLMQQHPRGFGYLLKDRILEIDDLLDAVERIAVGGFAVDPEVVQQLMTRSTTRSALSRLTPREAQVLSLIAAGDSNRRVSERLRMSVKTVENHVSSIFAKLDLTDDPTEHKRVRAVLLYLAANHPV